MIIRCERCSTTYELDEGLLAAEGSEVECSRCHHQFTARPPRAAGPTMVGAPVQAPPPAPVPEAPPAAPEARASPEAFSPPAEARAAPRLAARATPARSGPAVYRPAGAQPASARAPILRRDTVGAFEARLRWSHRWRWLAPALLVLLAAAAGGAWYVRRANPAAQASRAHARAMVLVLRDDVASLEQAAAELDAALRASPGLRTARADRALVDLLLAGALADGARSPEQQERGRALAAQAAGVLDELDREGVAAPEVARARAVAAALGSDRATVARLAAAARTRLADDAQVELAERGAEIRAADRGVRDRAVGALGMLAARRPELLRARYLLARGQGLVGRKAEALATVDSLLRANPRHEGATALRAELAAAAPKPPAAPPAPMAAPPAPSAAPPAQSTAPPPAAAPAPVRDDRPALLPRKPTQRQAEAAGTGPAGSVPPPTPRPALAVQPGTGAAEGATEDGALPPARLKPAAVPDPEPVQGGGG